MPARWHCPRMEYVLRERELHVVRVVVDDAATIEDCASRGLILVEVDRAKAGCFGRMAVQNPVAQVEVMNRLLHQIAAAFVDIEEPVARTAVMGQIRSRMSLRLSHDDVANDAVVDLSDGFLKLRH